MPVSVKIPHLKTDTALTICTTVLCPPSGPAPLACTTTAYSGRPPLSTRWITTRWLALFDRSCQPRFKLSPGLRALTAVVGQAPIALRSPASSAYRTAPDSRNARSERRSSSAVRTATTARSPIIASEKITPGRTNPRWSAARDFPIHRYVCTAYLTFLDSASQGDLRRQGIVLKLERAGADADLLQALGSQRESDCSHRGGGRGHGPERIVVGERQPAGARRQQRAGELLVGRRCAHPAPEPPAAARLILGVLYAPERAQGRPDLDSRRVLLCGDGHLDHQIGLAGPGPRALGQPHGSGRASLIDLHHPPFVEPDGVDERAVVRRRLDAPPRAPQRVAGQGRVLGADDAEALN